MKELKDICIDLEYAKKLKELGVKQESVYYYDKEYEHDTCYTLLYGNGYGEDSPYKYSAYTATELLELLPEYVEVNKLQNDYSVEKDFRDNKIHCKGDKKFPNALAKCYIYLIENKIIEV